MRSATSPLTDLDLQTEAWTTTHAILQSHESTVEAKLFAATTLKGKVDIYRALQTLALY